MLHTNRRRSLCLNRVQCAQWVGIDGWNNPADLIQAGTVTEVTVKNGAITQDAWAWYEWIPNGWTKIDNFAVTPGDTVDFTVCLPFSSLSHASSVADKP